MKQTKMNALEDRNKGDIEKYAQVEVDFGRDAGSQCIQNLDDSCLWIYIPKDKHENILLKHTPSDNFYTRCSATLSCVDYVRKKYADKEIRGDFVFGFHDSYQEDVPGRIVFSRQNHKKGIMMPDLYAMGGYSGLLKSLPDRPFEDKKDKAIFAGSSTGSLDPLQNLRLRACELAWTGERGGQFEAYCTNMCQIPIEQIKEAYPNYTEWARPHISVAEQLSYKYILSIDGNTACWDRVPWVLHSNSLLLKHESQHMCWYYPAMEDGKHFRSFNLDNIDTVISDAQNNLMQTQLQIMEASEFVAKWLQPICHEYYLACVLETCSNDGLR